MSLHSDTLFWFWANQSLLLLLNAACLAEKQQIPCNVIVFDFTLSGLEPTISPLEANMFNANSAIFQLYHDENKLIFNEMMTMSAMYLTNTLSWICIYNVPPSKQSNVYITLE
jgi:hypothetical protein